MKPSTNLGDIAAQKKQQLAAKQPPKVNPEIDAKIDAFIGQNKDLFDYYNSLPKERLVRQAMYNKMRQAEDQDRFQQKQHDKLQQWVDQRPELKAKIEEKLANVPEDRRQRAFIAIARNEQAKIGASIPPTGPRPSV